MLNRSLAAALAAALALGGHAFAGGSHDGGHDDDETHGPSVTRLAMPMMSSLRGMGLFVNKGCVACHAVNGVGGHDASALDAHSMAPLMNPFDMAAKMWAMAPAMIAAQEEALGEQILFTGDELADIIAFIHDDDQQHAFSEDMLDDRARRMMDHEHGGRSMQRAHEDEIGHHHDE